VGGVKSRVQELDSKGQDFKITGSDKGSRSDLAGGQRAPGRATEMVEGKGGLITQVSLEFTKIHILFMT